MLSRAVEVPKTFILQEITVDLFTGNDGEHHHSFLSLLCPTSSTSSVKEFKNRLSGVISSHTAPIVHDQIRVYFCGEKLTEDMILPKAILNNFTTSLSGRREDDDDEEELFRPRLVVYVDTIESGDDDRGSNDDNDERGNSTRLGRRHPSQRGISASGKPHHQSYTMSGKSGLGVGVGMGTARGRSSKSVPRSSKNPRLKSSAKMLLGGQHPSAGNISKKFLVDLNRSGSLRSYANLLKSEASSSVQLTAAQRTTLFDLEEELRKIDCEQYIEALRTAGLLKDEGAFERVREDDLTGYGLWLPKKARTRILVLGETLRNRLGIGVDTEVEGVVHAKPIAHSSDRRVYYTRAAIKAVGGNTSLTSLDNMSNQGSSSVLDASSVSREAKVLDARTRALVARVLRRTAVDAMDVPLRPRATRGYCCPAHCLQACTRHDSRARDLVHFAEMRLLTVIEKAAATHTNGGGSGGGGTEFVSRELLRALVEDIDLFRPLPDHERTAALDSSMVGHICDVRIFAKTLAAAYGAFLLAEEASLRESHDS